MKVQLIALFVCLTVAFIGQVSPLSDDQRQCVDVYLAAVEPLSIPEDVQEFVDTHARGSAPAGCEELNETNDRLYEQVPCAKKFNFGDSSLHEALRASPKVGRLYQTTAACAMAQAGLLRD